MNLEIDVGLAERIFNLKRHYTVQFSGSKRSLKLTWRVWGRI